MKTSFKGIKLIKDSEATVLHVYKDAVGLPTIGTGHLIKKGEVFTTITAQQADELLMQDLVQFEKGVSSLVKVPLNQNQFDALVSFSFNLGLGNLGSSTLLKKLNASDYAGASLEFSKWTKAGGIVLAGLVKRRAAEKALFLS